MTYSLSNVGHLRLAAFLRRSTFHGSICPLLLAAMAASCSMRGKGVLDPEPPPATARVPAPERVARVRRRDIFLRDLEPTADELSRVKESYPELSAEEALAKDPDQN